MESRSDFMPILSQSSNNNAMAIPEGQKKHGTHMTEKEMRRQEREFREKFLKSYPNLERDIQEHIKQFLTLAEEADQVQKKHTIVKWVARVTIVSSFILGGLGLALFQDITGFILAVYAISLALILLNAYTARKKERKYVSSIEAENKKLESTETRLKVIIGMFRGTARIVTERVCVNGGAFTGLEILMCIYKLVQESKGLLEQARSESGEMLRLWAQKVENMLVGLQQVYEMLQ